MLPSQATGWSGHTLPASCRRDRSTSAALSLAAAWDLVGTSSGEGNPEQVLPSPPAPLSSSMLPSGYPDLLQLQMASHIVRTCPAFLALVELLGPAIAAEHTSTAQAHYTQ